MDLKVSHLQLITDIVKLGSLTLAAKAQGWAVSTASRNLQNLQEYFNDPLFVRTHQGMVATDTVKRLLPDIQNLIASLSKLDQKKVFDPSFLHMTLTIGAADNAILAILLPVFRHLLKVCPDIKVRLQPLSGYQFENLAQGELDFLLYPTSCIQTLPTHFKSLLLNPIQRAILVASDHPLAEKYRQEGDVTLSDLCAYPRIAIKLQDRNKEAIFNLDLKERYYSKTVVEIPYFLGAPYLLLGTRNTVLLPRSTAIFFEKHIVGLTSIPVTLDAPSPYTRLVWHERSDSSVEMQWIRSVIKTYAGVADDKVIFDGEPPVFPKS